MKKQISNNLFKPLMNKGLLSHQGAFPRSVLIYGPIDTERTLWWSILLINCSGMSFPWTVLTWLQSPTAIATARHWIATTRHRFATTRHLSRPPDTYRDHPTPIATTRHPSRPPDTHRDHPTPIATTRHL